MVALADTNVLVYAVDSRFPEKQRIARAILRRGIETDSIRIAHQAVIEFLAATMRGGAGRAPLLPPEIARIEAERLLDSHTVLYPTEALVRIAIHGMATYQLSWFDAHMWACARHYGIPTLLSEDFEHDRTYGKVRVLNPFLGTTGLAVGEPRAEYRASRRRRARRQQR